MPDDLPARPNDAAALGHSYAALLDGQSGEGDVPPVAEEAVSAPPSPLRIIEALLFIGGAPLTAVRACEVIRGLTLEQFTQAIDELTAHDERPFADMLVEYNERITRKRWVISAGTMSVGPSF